MSKSKRLWFFTTTLVFKKYGQQPLTANASLKAVPVHYLSGPYPDVATQCLQSGPHPDVAGDQGQPFRKKNPVEINISWV